MFLTKIWGLYSVTLHYTLWTDETVIETIKHKGLRQLYEKNDRSGIRPDLVEKMQKILSALEAGRPARHLFSDG